MCNTINELLSLQMPLASQKKFCLPFIWRLDPNKQRHCMLSLCMCKPEADKFNQVLLSQSQPKLSSQAPKSLGIVHPL